MEKMRLWSIWTWIRAYSEVIAVMGEKWSYPRAIDYNEIVSMVEFKADHENHIIESRLF